MVTQSAVPPNDTGDASQNTVATAVEAVMPMTNKQQEANKAATNETSIFVNEEPVREEQVENAIKFLSHPKVRGSPVMYRRSFLEKKGLTREEIDEAFRLVPDESPSLSATKPSVSNQGGRSQPSSNIQPQVSTQSLQPVTAAPTGPNSNLNTLTASRFHWSHALLALGILATSGVGTALIFTNSIVPRLKTWIRKVVLEDEEQGVANKTNEKPTLVEEAAAAAKAATTAAANVTRASQEMLILKTEEKINFGALMSLLKLQVQEVKSVSNSLKKLEGNNNNSGREDSIVQAASSRQLYANGEADYDSPHPKSYAEIMATVPRVERPPNIKPWEAGSTHRGPSVFVGPTSAASVGNGGSGCSH